MILDSSVILAMILGEDDAERIALILAAEWCLKMSAGNLLEVFLVVDGRGDPIARGMLDAILQRAGVEIIPLSYPQVLLARQAYRDYGKGNHLARLNMGDCYAYALSKESGEAIFAKGLEFSRTDLDVVQY